MFSWWNSLFRRRHSVSSVLFAFIISVLILGLLPLYFQMKYSSNMNFVSWKMCSINLGIQNAEEKDAEQVVLAQRPCQMDSCFTYSICPIFTKISYNLLITDSHQENNLLRAAALNSSAAAQAVPSKSPCLTVLLLSRCRNNDTSELDEYFSQENYPTKISNYLIFLNCPENSDWESKLFAVRKIHVLKKAIIVSPFASTTSGFAKGFDIVSTTFLGERSTSVLDVSNQERSILVNFDETCIQHHNQSIFLLKQVMEQEHTSVSAIFACGGRVCDSKYCTKCDGDQKYALRHSIFTVISLPKDTTVLSTLQLQQKLFQILQYGSVPVVIGPRFLPPFEEIIDWSQVLVRIPEAQLMHIPEILFRYSQSVREAMRHQGGLVFNQHLRTLKEVMTTTFSVISSRLSFSGIHYVPRKSKLVHSLAEFNSTVKIQAGNITVSNQTSTNRSWFVPEPNFRTTTQLWAQQQHSKSTKQTSVTNQDQFTIVILTFNRVKQLTNLLAYLNGLTRVNKIIVAWSSQIPNNTTWWPENMAIPIHAIQTEKNSLNNRFYPFEAIETDAILSLDDDMYVRHEDLLLGFRVWQENQNRLVGYLGRNALSKNNGKKWTYMQNSCPVSIILTGCAFIHKMYLVYYTFQMPDYIRKTVDRLMNCEDIAMNFLVQHLSQKPPIKITSKKYFSCSRCSPLANNSLSKIKRHLKKRSWCITEFSKVYGYTPLFNTYIFFKKDSYGVLRGCL